jgi:hypothetical protein
MLIGVYGSAHEDESTHARLVARNRAEGYDGGIRQLKEYIREIRLAPPDAPVERFETEPGRQLQIDFVVFRRGELPLRAFTCHDQRREQWTTRTQEDRNKAASRKSCVKCQREELARIHRINSTEIDLKPESSRSR